MGAKGLGCKLDWDVIDPSGSKIIIDVVQRIMLNGKLDMPEVRFSSHDVSGHVEYHFSLNPMQLARLRAAIDEAGNTAADMLTERN